MLEAALKRLETSLNLPRTRVLAKKLPKPETKTEPIAQEVKDASPPKQEEAPKPKLKKPVIKKKEPVKMEEPEAGLFPKIKLKKYL